MTTSLTLSLLLLAPVLTAQQPATPPQSNQDSGRIAGKVTHQLSGQPIRRANVTVQSMPGRSGAGQTGSLGSLSMPPSFTASTEDGGQFSFENLPAGRYFLRVERTGFVPTGFGARPGSGNMGGPITLTPGQRLEDLSIKMLPQAVIAGKVVDEEGEPVLGVQIMALRQGRYRTRGGRAMPMGSHSSNDLGEFRVANLAPGRYTLSASARRGPFGPRGRASARSEAPEEQLVTTYYPGVTDMASAAPIEVTAGQEVNGILIQLRKARVYRVSGRLSGLGEAATRSFVNLYPKGRLPMGFMGGGMAQILPDGSFEIQGVQPGSYHLHVYRGGNGRQAMAARVPVEVAGANVEGLVIPVGNPLSLTGIVRMEGSEESQNIQGHIGFRPSEGMPMNMPSTAIKADGTFVLESVPRDKMHLQVMGLPEGLYVRSARMGSQNILDKGLDLTLVESAPPLEIFLSAKSGTVSGAVLNDKEVVPGSMITLIPEPIRADRPDLFKTANSDEQGAFSFKGVAPGEYKLYAWDEMIFDAFFDPEFMKAFAGSGKRVKIQENGHERVELTLVKEESAGAQ
ncbi:MAG: carboxypeptidase regulatory-like domain-containing protein [Bryobacteraceae bacterium]